jgi:hypothetical protein
MRHGPPRPEVIRLPLRGDRVAALFGGQAHRSPGPIWSVGAYDVGSLGAMCFSCAEDARRRSARGCSDGLWFGTPRGDRAERAWQKDHGFDDGRETGAPIPRRYGLQHGPDGLHARPKPLGVVDPVQRAAQPAEANRPPRLQKRCRCLESLSMGAWSRRLGMANGGKRSKRAKVVTGLSAAQGGQRVRMMPAEIHARPKHHQHCLADACGTGGHHRHNAHGRRLAHTSWAVLLVLGVTLVLPAGARQSPALSPWRKNVNVYK